MRTTLALPDDVLARVDQAVRDGKARSRNDFVAQALRHELEAIERASIDAAFATMADDPATHEEARQLDAEFAQAGWEALHESER